MDPVIAEFDGRALYAALDAKREAEALSWPAAAAAIWDMASVLNDARAARGRTNHPISPSTLHYLGKRGDTSCQHALFFLRWLDRTPESFSWPAPASTPACRCPRAGRTAARGGT
jgi:hypothetical protein